MSSVPSAGAARAFVTALAGAGVRHVCITPGSRSTPLTMAFAGHPGIRAWLHLDERSSAYFALGLARATGLPTSIVSTSGTAAANLLPAVVESNLSRVPLIVCTADRPPHLRDVGADQTIDQVGMFGRNVRHAQDLPVPTGRRGEEEFFRGAAIRAARMAAGPLPGPVHLNFPFDEPLIGQAGGYPSAAVETPTRPALPHAAPSPEDVATAVGALRDCRRPLIVAGPESGGLPAAPIARLGAEIGAPILADPLSGLRTGPHDRSHVLDSYDALVRDRRADAFAPDAIVRFGGVPTSKALNQFLARTDGAVHVLCDLWQSWRDPAALTDLVVAGDPAAVCEALCAALAPSAGSEPGWLDGWLNRDERARDAMQAAAAAFEEPFEGRVFAELQAALSAGATLVVGNSMPVRDLDAFLVSHEKPLRLIANRGANGIDGVTSTALGVAAASAGPVVLVIGDLSFYHDLNGLWAAKRHALDLTVVLVNNNGGGIFHYLPQAEHPGVFEEWFGTPADLDFSLATRLYGGCHVVAEDWATLRAAIARIGEPGLRVVELRTDRARNVAMHRAAWAAAASAAWGPPE